MFGYIIEVMETTRTINHGNGHTDTETYLQDADGVWVWAVTKCNEETMKLNKSMSQLEYAKQYAPASRIPESFLTMGDIVTMLERIEELKAEVANANEGSRLMHSVAMKGEQSALSHIDNHVDTVDAVAWKDESDVSQYFNGIPAHASKTWRERHLNSGG
jgi:hypothetical protein